MKKVSTAMGSAARMQLSAAEYGALKQALTVLEELQAYVGNDLSIGRAIERAAMNLEDVIEEKDRLWI